MAPSKHVLLVSSALLRLLRAEVVRVRNEHAAVESRLRRANSRADSAASEIALLEEDASALQVRDSASSDVIRSLRQQVAALEERLTDREEKLSEKEDELLTARQSSRSSLETSCGQSSSRGCLESDDDSDADSASGMSRLEETESLLRSERGGRKALEDRLALAQTQLSNGAADAEVLRQELDEARLENVGLEERSLVLEEDRSQAMVSAADAEDMQVKAEAAAAGAKAELTVVMLRVGSAAAQVESMRSRIVGADERHECTVKLHRREILDLQERLAEVESERARSLIATQVAVATDAATQTVPQTAQRVAPPSSDFAARVATAQVARSPRASPVASPAVPVSRRQASEAHAALGPAIAEKLLARKAVPMPPMLARTPRAHAPGYSPRPRGA